MTTTAFHPPSLLFAGLLVGLAIAPSATAGEGLFEINQSCADGAGCFSGDSPGLPVEITQPGSYQFTSNVETGDPDQTVITIDADRVTVDLNGFSIDGPNFCLTPQDGDTCSDNGSGIGIESISTSSHISIRNGHVVGLGSHGVRVESGPAIIEGLTVQHCGGEGIGTGGSSQVSGNSVRRNQQHGIHLSDSGRARDNVVSKNGGYGILAESGFTDEALILDNLVLENADEGLFLDDHVAYARNVMRGNNGGNANPQVAGGLQLDFNLCGTDTACP